MSGTASGEHVSAIRVLGIDRDGESRLLVIEYLTPQVLAQELHRADWKQATLERDGKLVGGVELSARTRQRIWWADEENDNKEQP